MRASKPGAFCERSKETERRIEEFSRLLESEALRLSGMTEKEFSDSGLLTAAIERLRGISAASTEKKRTFMRDTLDHHLGHAVRKRGTPLPLDHLQSGAHQLLPRW